jgi:hypothetical protein
MKFTPQQLQIPAQAGTAKRVLDGLKAGVMRGVPERAEARTTNFQIPAQAGTTIRALAGLKAGAMRSFPERAEARTTYLQIPAQAGTAKRVLVGFKAGAMRGFQNGLKPEQRTRKSRSSYLGSTMKTEVQNLHHSNLTFLSVLMS